MPHKPKINRRDCFFRPRGHIVEPVKNVPGGCGVSELILHHFDWSPYAEKVRVLLGIKRLAWRSVQIPMVMPKPDLTALTGGYRKTPVLQIGADIYCDTSCIARELESALSRSLVLPSQWQRAGVRTGGVGRALLHVRRRAIDGAQ